MDTFNKFMFSIYFGCIIGFLYLILIEIRLL